MELVVVIELSPFTYAQSEYTSPNGSVYELPEEWERYWLRCLADSKLDRLRAVKEGSWFVDITSINDVELETIVLKQIGDGDEEGLPIEEQLAAMDGGVVLIADGRPVIEPSCCGDLGNLSEWEEILVSPVGVCKDLWIGHPWIFYNNRGTKVDFSDYSDLGLLEMQEWEPKIIVNTSELQNELRKARRQQREFGQRIKLILDKMGIKRSKCVSERLVGLN